MDYLNDLHEMCDTLSNELREANEKINAGGGKLSGDDISYIDKLTHAIKSIKTTIAMMEAEGGTSGYDGTYTGTYGRRGSYARGRRRDSMGRYSSRYSGSNDMIAELRDLMEDAPDERTRQEFKRFIAKMEAM